MAQDDDAPRSKRMHELGQKLDELSVRDFDERIALLRAEIARLEAAKADKERALDAAGSIFLRAPARNVTSVAKRDRPRGPIGGRAGTRRGAVASAQTSRRDHPPSGHVRVSGIPPRNR